MSPAPGPGSPAASWSAMAWASFALPPPSSPPSMPGDRISCWASLNCRSRAFTSCVVVPLPRAMRMRRDPSITAGSARSAGVMDRMIASTWATWPSSIASLACFNSFGTPGMSDRSPPSEPSFFTCWSWARKSSRLKRPSSRAAAPSWATSWSNSRSACSIKLSMSPMPRIRLAMRSGWNWSKSARRSPVDAKAIGRPTTSLTLRRGAAAGVAVELREDHTVELEGVVERLARWPRRPAPSWRR